MSRINKDVLSALIAARKCFERQPERVAYFTFEQDRYGSNEQCIVYTIIKDSTYYGKGLSVYDRSIYVATFDEQSIDLFQVGIAASTAPPKPTEEVNAPAN